MGMTAAYIMISASELDTLLAGGINAAFAIWKRRWDPDCWFTGETSEEDGFREAQQRGFHLWIDLGKRYGEAYWLLMGQEFPESSVVTHRDVELHFSAPHDPLSLAMCAEDTVPETDDFGYGPIRYVTPEMVHSIAKVLENTTWSDLAKKHDLDAEEGDIFYWSFIKLSNLYQRASKAGNAILQVFV